jgi:hypothetical protein
MHYDFFAADVLRDETRAPDAHAPFIDPILRVGPLDSQVVYAGKALYFFDLFGPSGGIIHRFSNAHVYRQRF